MRKSEAIELKIVAKISAQTHLKFCFECPWGTPDHPLPAPNTRVSE
jgi:hypothetical protein